MGVVAAPLQIGAWSGVKHLDGMPTWCVCTTLGAQSVRMRVASSSANVGLCSTYVGECVSMWICTFVYGVAIPAPQTNLNQPWVTS